MLLNIKNTDVIAALGVERAQKILLQRDSSEYEYNLFHWAGQCGKAGIFKAILDPNVIKALGQSIVQEILLAKD